MRSKLCLSILVLTLGSSVIFAQTRPATQPSFNLNPNLPTFWIIGDSTVRNGQDNGNNGQWGWGKPIASYFDATKINVVNYALGGTSSRTYQSMGRWDHVLAAMKPGDYVIMQFGTNDSSAVDDNGFRNRGVLHGNGEETQVVNNQMIHNDHEVVHTYGWYLRKFINDAKAKGAAGEIVCSQIPRNGWSQDGKTVNRATTWAQWGEEAAKEAGGSYINLNELIAKRYEAEGKDAVTAKYFPDKEATHTDWAGAILIAQCVVEGIKSLSDCDLAKYLLANPPTDLPLPSGKAR